MADATFTPIHGALGLDAQPLTWAHLEQCVQAEVPESDQLDWKRAVPSLKADADKDEFAKDVAAMLNSGGGWIVYGVDDGDRDVAASLRPFKWTQAQERRLRQVAYAHVSPPAMGLEFTEVTADDGGGSVVLMRVPYSSQTPHLAKKGHSFWVPFRNGRDTEFMSERMIEHAYKSRFESSRGWEKRFAELVGQARAGVEADENMRLVVVAHPHDPVPHTLVSETEAQDAALAGQDLMLVHRDMRIDDRANWLPGLRRWIWRTGQFSAEFHTDGTFTMTRLVDRSNDGSITGRIYARELESYLDAACGLAAG